MTKERKSELIAQLVNILNEMIEVDSASQKNAPSDTVEMLTIKECAETVKVYPSIPSASSSSRRNCRIFVQVKVKTAKFS